MRIASEGENLVGKVCVCSIGRVAVVTGERQFDWGHAYVGLGLDGKGTWASRRPCVIAETMDEFRAKLDERFGGKLSFNG